MFTSLFSFSSRNLSSWVFLFAVNCIGPKTLTVTSWISQTAKIKSITEIFFSEKDFWNWFIYNTSHKFWGQSPFPHYQCCLQLSETVSWHKLCCCYSANLLQHWVGGRGLIYFSKVDYSRISRIFSTNWVGLNNLCEIL